jgi:hypothetical protein
VIETQTIRQFLAGRKRKLIFVLIVCWLGIFVPMAVGADRYPAPPWLAIVSVVFFAGAMAAIIGILFFIRCPRCKGLLGTNNAPLIRNWIGVLGRRINFCPYCGVSLDEPYENHGTPRHPGPLA